MSRRLAFGHQARVGKDTACEYLKNKYGGDIYHFSDNLYKILHYAQETCGFPIEKDVSFLQWVGTEWGRRKDYNVWVNSTLRRIGDGNCYIGDLRFPNEIEELKKHGFKCVKIVRTDRPIDRDTTHISETALQDYTEWDHVIFNNGDLDDFYKRLDELMDE